MERKQNTFGLLQSKVWFQSLQVTESPTALLPSAWHSPAELAQVRAPGTNLVLPSCQHAQCSNVNAIFHSFFCHSCPWVKRQRKFFIAGSNTSPVLCQQTRKFIHSFTYPGKNAGKLWRAYWYSMKSGRVTSLSESRTQALSHHQHSQLETSLHARRGFLYRHRRSETQDCKQAGGRTYSEVRDVTNELGQPAASQQWSWRSCLCLVNTSSTAVHLITGLELEHRKSDPSPHLYSSNGLITAAMSLAEG